VPTGPAGGQTAGEQAGKQAKACDFGGPFPNLTGGTIMRLDPERIKALTASTSTYVAAIAESEDLLPMLAAAWTEMTLRQPKGHFTIREVLDRASEKAERRGDVEAAARYRRALADFEAHFAQSTPETVAAE
jgi:hypothetical protein